MKEKRFVTLKPINSNILVKNRRKTNFKHKTYCEKS